MDLEPLEDIRKEARELYNGEALSELEESFEKDKEFAEKLETLSLKFKSKFIKHERSHEGPQKELVVNNLGNIMFEADVEEITDFKKLYDIMVASYKEKKSVKAVGGFSSFSQINYTNGFLLLTKKFSGTTKTDTKLLKSDVNQQAIKDDIVYYDVKCGTTVRKVIQDLKEDDRALSNLGGYDGQTIVGLNATSTHGSGIQIPPLASSIKAVDLIVPGGQLYRIEPTDGITDPTSFKASNSVTTLIQNDDTFNCSIVHLGALGVVFNVIISTVKLYSIIDEREETTWNKAKSILKQPYKTNPYLKHRNCEVWISPYTSYTIIVKRDIATEEDKQVHPKPKIKTWFQELLDTPLISEIAEKTTTSSSYILYFFLLAFPGLVPFISESALKAQFHPGPVVDEYNNIYLFGLVNDVKAISIELAFPMKDDNHLNAVDALLETLKEMYDKNELYINGPLSLRFSSSLSQFLSMANNNEGIPTCYVEMAILYHNSSHFHSQVFNSLMATALKFSGRCHWGQYLPPDLDLNYLTNSYGKENVEKFIKQIERFDPQGLMRNDLLLQLGLRSTELEWKR